MAITYVGGLFDAGPNNTTGSTTISLSGTLTGGLASSPSAGDIVIIGTFIGTASDADLSVSGNNSGDYSEAADLYANDNRDAALGVHYIIQGSTVDTSVTVTHGVTSVQRGVCHSVYVWRGVDGTTPIDVTTQNTTGVNSANVNPASITPSTSDALIVIAGIGTQSYEQTADFTSWSTGFGTRVGGPCATLASGFKPVGALLSLAWTGGAVDPSAWSLASSGPQDSWAASTLVLRPAADTGVSVSLTGVSSTAANWSPSLSREAPVAGASSSAESGLSPAFREAALAGVSALSGDGSVGYALAPALVGQEAPGASGTPGVDRLADLFGYEAISAAGVLSTVSGAGVELTGVLAQSAQWSMTPDRQAPILSALGQSAAGLLIPGRAVPVSGQSATGASGTLSAGRLVDLLGASGISGYGVPMPGRSASPTGQEALTALGVLGATAGDDSHPRFCCVGT